MKRQARSFGRAPAGVGLIARALIEKNWRDDGVRAQIHAIMGDDGHAFVNAAGRMFWVILGAAVRDGVDPEQTELRILRGAANALYEQAEEAVITPERRAAIASGLDSCERLLPALERRSVIDAACELDGKLRRGDVRWRDFEGLLEAVAA